VPLAVAKRKSRGVASLTAILLGGFGLHKFYLGNYLAGIVYLVFCWTLIPSLAGLFEGIKYALMDDWDFQRRYCD
jgi:TM2 domain-containing membrane protein YozV